MYLVLIETSGNQRFIFSTNKLKENIGASELTYRAGTMWVLEAVADINTSQGLIWHQDSKQFRRNLLQQESEQFIQTPDIKVEVIVATSGKALLLTKEREDAKAVIHKVTRRALHEAPGLDVCGVIQYLDWYQEKSVAEAVHKVHKEFSSVHSSKPSPYLRFLRLPVVEECSTSGLPAFRLVSDGESKSAAPLSYVSLAKQECSEASLQRMARILKETDEPNIKLARNVRQLEAKFTALDWLAVIHADGNGLGEIFLNFENYIENPLDNREYINQLRQFSVALDVCTEEAFLSALNTFTPGDDGLIPVVPLVLGGDDLTVICEGKGALKFTKVFLTAFEQETASSSHVEGIIPKIAKKALQVERLSACAGVAIIKPHFPFSVAYDLSEELMKSAKQVKKKVTNKNTQPYPCSAIDFHILYDSSDVELGKIRSKLEMDDGTEKTKLYKRPYVVTPQAELKCAVASAWAKFHCWESLEELVQALKDTKDGRYKLPNSQMHDLRTGLFLGKQLADARFKLIYHRYIESGIHKLQGDPNSLFQQEPTSNIYITGLLDAIEAAEFLDLEK